MLICKGLLAQRVKRLPTMQETRVQSLGREDLLEKEMVTHSSILAWKIPWTEKSGRLQAMGSQSRTRLSDFTFTLWKTVGKILKELKIELSCDQANPLLGIYPKAQHELKRYTHPMLTAAALTIAKVHKQLKCPLMDEWIHCGTCAHTRVHTHACTHTCMYTHVYTRTRVHTHADMLVIYYSVIK